MSKRMNGGRGGSSKRRDITSDHVKDQEVRSVNGIDSGHGGTEEARSQAILAASNGALQRLADIARYVESSFNREIDVIEGVYGADMDQEKEIRRLNEALETLTHVKSEKMENLEHENRDLKAGQEACSQEREKCRTIQAELEEQYTKAEAEREKDYKQKLQEERTKFQKSTKAMKAEIDIESKERVQELQDRIEKLSATNENLEQRLSAAKEKLEAKKTRHARVEKSLEDENKNIKAELKQIKSEFPVKGQPVQHYADKFRQISEAVEDVASKYFRKLPERAIANSEAVHNELNELDPIFQSTPIWESEVSEFLRLRGVQRVISGSMCDFIWHPFFPQDTLPNHPGCSQFLEAVSKSLSVLGGRSESIWRVLTLRGIDGLGGALMESHQAESTVHRILEVLQPLTIPSQSARLEDAVVGIVQESITLWRAAQTDEAKIVVQRHPNPSDEERWHAEDIQGLEEASIPSDMKIDSKSIQPHCIFPNILRITPCGETVVLHQGRALFPTSRVWIHGMLEQKEHDEELAKAMSDARSKVSARRTSFPTGPNSPTAGKFPKT